MKKVNKITSLLLISLIVSACTTINPNSSSSNIIVSSSSSSIKESTSSSSSESVSSSSLGSSSVITSSSSNVSIDYSKHSKYVNKLYSSNIESNEPDYYESVRGLKGEELKDALNELIDDHTEYSYNASINEYMKIYDKDLNNENNIMLIYSGSALKNSTFDKEHVWAKSHGDFGTTIGAGSDLHNLRPCSNALNSSRGNKNFAEGGTEYESFPGNFQTETTFEPRDDFKGDVARTIFYMATRYNDSSLDLELDSPSDTTRYLDLSNNATGTHGSFDDLYKWATSGIDAVDDYEVNRNNIIYSDYQHNRNPFVDHPEFIVMIYDKEYDGAGALNDLMLTEVSAYEQAQEVETLIDSIGIVQLSSSNDIQKAENAYNELNDDIKLLVNNRDDLFQAREEYNYIYETTIVSHITGLISEIGEVGLNSQDYIINIEALYNALDEDKKSQIYNYDDLIKARETLDALLEEYELSNKVIYSGSFGESSGISGKYATYTFTLSGKSWYINQGFKSGSDFRLGGNKSNSIDAKFYTALGLSSSPDASSLEMQWDISNAKGISLDIGTNCYGTISKIYILKSLDGGVSYSLCGGYVKDETITYEGEIESQVRYAIVVTGTTPRLGLINVTIRGMN